MASSDPYLIWSTSAGSGEPVVMLHGAFCDFRYWEPQQIAFGRRRRAIAVSLRGYYPDETDGRDAKLSAEQHVEDVGAFLRALAEPVHLVGHSRGGRIALHVGARFPQSVRTLALIEPGGVLAPDLLRPAAPSESTKPPPAGDVRQDAWALIQRGDREAGLRLYIDSGHGVGAWDRAPAIFKRVATANARSIVGMIADVSAPLSRAVAAKIIAPTLLVGGGRSPPLFGRVLDALGEAISGSRRVLIDNGDHFVSLTEPDAFNQALEHFWGHGRRAASRDH